MLLEKASMKLVTLGNLNKGTVYACILDFKGETMKCFQPQILNAREKTCPVHKGSEK